MLKYVISVAVSMAAATAAAADSQVVVNPPVTAPFKTTIVNATPQDWQAQIRAVNIELYYDDLSHESINDQSSNLPTGSSKSYVGQAIKCVWKERVSMSVYDKRGSIHVFDKWNTTQPKCLASVISTLAPAGQ